MQLLVIIGYDCEFTVHMYLSINEMCTGHMKMISGHANMAGEYDCEQNCTFIMYDKVA